MATITTKGTIQGVTGPVYHRILNGKQITQTRPDRRKQEKGKNTYAKMFQNIAFDLKLIRLTIVDFLRQRHDNKVHLRLTGQTMKLLNKQTDLPVEKRSLLNTSLHELTGFQWNVNNAFEDAFLGGFQIAENENNTLEITVESFIPKEQVNFPPKCTHAVLRLAAFSLLEQSKMFVDQANYLSVSMAKNQELVVDTTAIFNKPKDVDNIFLIAEIQFYYPINNNPEQLTLYNSKVFNPSTIIYAR